MPILIGAGQFTQRTAQQGKLEESLDPMQLLVEVSNRAAADTGAAEKIFKALDTIAVVRFTADSSEAGRLPVGQYKNAPRTLGNRIGANGAASLRTRRLLLTSTSAKSTSSLARIIRSKQKCSRA